MEKLLINFLHVYFYVFIGNLLLMLIVMKALRKENPSINISLPPIETSIFIVSVAVVFKLL